jgi:hypothetical protein
MRGVVLRFELLEERGKTAGEGHRGSVVLRLEALPDCRQPSASTANKGCPVLRSAIHPRLADNTRCRYVRERRRWLVRCRRLQSIGTKFGRAIAQWVLNHVSADPIVEAVGGLNRGLEAVLYRGGGRFGAADCPGGCRHGDAPLSYASRTAAIGPRHGLARLVPYSTPTTQRTPPTSGSRHLRPDYPFGSAATWGDRDSMSGGQSCFAIFRVLPRKWTLPIGIGV